MSILYLDNAATTEPSPEVRAAMEPYLGPEHGNPSSRHPLGVRAADALETARKQIARALGVRPEAITFTSGGTEANNLAVLGLARAASTASRGTRRHVLVGPTEHPCVRESALALVDEGFEVEEVGITEDGLLDLEDLARRLRPETALVAQMLVNNEMGAVYPVRAVAECLRARAPQALLHVDAVQAFGKLDVRPVELGADSLAISSHKIHGPKGVGALVLESRAKPRPLVFGGGQEEGRRSGTENVAGIVGFGAAAAQADEHLASSARAMAELNEAFCRGLEDVPGVSLLRPRAGELVPNIVAVRVPGAPAEVYLHHLETREIYVGTGSACQSKKKDISPALASLGLRPEEARFMLRFSFARTTRPADVTRALEALAEVTRELAAAAR